MSSKNYIIIGSLLVVGIMLSATWMILRAKAAEGESESPRQELLKSGIIRSSEAQKSSGDWGKMDIFVNGDSEQSANVFAATAVINAGEALHPTHKHSGEEFLVLTKGSGEWYLNGKSFPAKQGDVMYVEPGDRHGLRNTSDKPLTFFVAKWESKE